MSNSTHSPNCVSQDIRSFIIPFAPNRELNKGKKQALNAILHTEGHIRNTISKDMFNGYALWQDMSKDDNTFIRKHYEHEFKQTKLKAVFVQNMVANGTSGYFDTLKALKALSKKGYKPGRMKKPPYAKTPSPFHLDDRHLGTKGETIVKDAETGIYYFQIINPNIDKRGEYIKLPLTGFDYVQTTLDSIVSGTFNGKAVYAITERGIKLTTTVDRILGTQTEIEDLNIRNVPVDISDMEASVPKVEGLDFGKKITLSDGTVHNLSKFYKKAKKIKTNISQKDKELAKLKKDKMYDKMKIIKEERLKLHKQITGMRKSTYRFIAKALIKHLISIGVQYLAIENLTFGPIKKNSKKYKGRGYNTMLSVMSRSAWMEAVVSVALGEGFPILLVDPSYTSQTCSKCGHTEALNRVGALLKCLRCTYESDADLNGSVSVKRLGIAGLYKIMVK